MKNSTSPRKGSGKRGKANPQKDPKNNRGGPPHKNNDFWKNLISVAIALLAVAIIWPMISEQRKPDPVPLSELAADIRAGEVEHIEIEGSTVRITYNDETERRTRKEDGASFAETISLYGVDLDADYAPVIDVKEPSGFLVFLSAAAPLLIPLLFLVFIFWFLSRQMRGAGMQAFNFGQSKARIVDPANKGQRVKFDDVAGSEEAKEELKEIVDFLKNPKKFLSIGARIPKGVLLMGPPGSGKTLLARAVAGEAGVPFFTISGSEFVEMFVGVGASRVRDLFKLAKNAAPAIIFVDEIDAVGRVRGSGHGGGNDEREQTLNQILVEMDGFEPNEKVIVMAATNRPDVLDTALLRPGRFDRRVTLSLPDRNERKMILEVHADKKPLEEDVDFSVVAERTPGFSGADLYSLVNEGAILAARENRKKISQFDLIRSIEKVMLGPERRSRLLTKKEKEITAYHEAGHAIVASLLPLADPVRKISIIARGHAGGYVLRLPLEERRMQSKKEFLDSIAVALGGYAAERAIFGDLTTGPSNDLEVSTALARDMVTKYGMSDKLGPIAYSSSEGKILFGTRDEAQYSEEVSAMIDAEVSSIMTAALERAQGVVQEHSKLLDAIAKRLIEKETIEHNEFESILEAHDVEPKRKPKEAEKSIEEEEVRSESK